MKCPHCSENFHETWTMGQTGARPYSIRSTSCPACGRATIELGQPDRNGFEKWRLVVPAVATRTALPQTVPASVVDDYREAEAVLPMSPKASAALSRRLLQRLLRTYGQVSHGTLYAEIGEAIPTLPSHLADAIDGVRVTGNFAAHPIKSENTGEIVDVEPGEAEWNLETIAALIDFYIVAPAALQARRDALDAKLADAGKPPTKGSEGG